MASKPPTTTINTLPPECLELILLNLGTDPNTLSSLLRVSRLFFSLTLPILYSDPFSICPNGKQLRLHKVILDSATAHGCFSVKAFLEATRGQCGSLDCHGQCESGAKLQVIMDTEQVQEEEEEEEENKAEAAHDMDARRSQGEVEPLRQARMTRARPRTMARYIDFLTHYDGQRWLNFATNCLKKKNQQHLTTKLLVRMHTRIVDHTAERLVSMVLLPGIIRDIIPIAYRLRSLVRLKLAGGYNSDELKYVCAFLSARHRNVDIWAGEQDSDGSDDGSRGYTERKTHNNRRKRSAVIRGIEDLTLPLILYSAPSHHSVACQYQLARQIQFQQLEILRSLGTQLTSLDANHCSDFLKIAHQIPCHLLKNLKTFKSVQGDSLESLVLNVYNHKQLRTVLCGHAVAHLETTAISDTPFQLNPQTLQLPLLKKLRLHLRMLQENSFVTIGAAAPFEGCPLLEDLVIAGPVPFPIAPSFNGGSGGVDVLRIPRLKHLELQAGAAKGFRFESLRFLPLLESLVLDDNIVTLAYQPAPPQYTDTNTFQSGHLTTPWTWTMNHLTKMHLKGPPAFHFRFEWLRHCPALISLIVDGLLSSAFLHLQDPETHVANGHEVAPAAEAARWSKHLSQCYLDIFTQPQDPQINRHTLAAALETYCYNVQELKLNTFTISRHLPHHQPGPAPAPTAIIKDDLGLALYVSRNLPHLKRLATNHESDTPFATLLRRYGLVQGRVVRVQCDEISGHDASDSEVVVVWCPSIAFKPFEIDLLSNIKHDGSLRFRQRASWQFSDLKS
ncbi:hypothetical protein BGW39_008237 [Mortierella sp. 14UC]|nr:hypothetical protein BGW39_008237 [Mortierella sp. 14UC]